MVTAMSCMLFRQSLREFHLRRGVFAGRTCPRCDWTCASKAIATPLVVHMNRTSTREPRPVREELRITTPLCRYYSAAATKCVVDVTPNTFNRCSHSRKSFSPLAFLRATTVFFVRLPPLCAVGSLLHHQTWILGIGSIYSAFTTGTGKSA